MKFLKLLLMLTLPIAIWSCKENDVDGYQGNNDVILAFNTGDGTSATILSNSQETTTLNVKLTTTINSPVTFALDIPQEAQKYISTTPTEATIKAGERLVSFTIGSTKVSPDKNTVYTIGCHIVGNHPGNVAVKNHVTLTVVANKPEVVLNAHDQALIDHYKKTYNLDLMPLLGQYQVHDSINIYKGEENNFDVGTIFNSTTNVSLSPLATEDRPILAMTTNAFGLNNYFNNLYTDLTVADTEYWNNSGVPDNWAVIQKFHWTKDTKVTTNVGFYTIEIDPSTKKIKDNSLLKTINEILKLPTVDSLNKPDSLITYLGDGSSELYVPFTFNISLWDQCLDYVKKNPTDKDFSKKLIGINISPYQILYNSTEKDDDWGNDPSNFIKPSLTIDWDKKVIKLDFSADYNGAQEASGYNQIHAICTKVPYKSHD